MLVEQVSEYAIFLLDPSGVISSWNRGAQRIKGYTADEIVGQHFSKFYRPEDVWKCNYELDVATREGRVEDEGWRVRKDGSLFWANVVITRLSNTDGELVGFAKVTRDLTERRRAEEVLRQSEERFRLLVESVRDYAIFMLDPQGIVATWNVGAERIKGYRADEIVGQHFSRFYPEEDGRLAKCEMELERATQDGRFEDEGWRVRKDGSWFWANVVITVLRDASGAVLGFAKVTRDLTERRAAEEERLRLGRLARDRIQVLGSLAEVLAGGLSVDQVARLVADHLAAFVQGDVTTVHLLDESSATLRLAAERGGNPHIIAQVREITSESSNPTYAIGTGAADGVWIENPEQYEVYLPQIAGMSVAGPRAQAFWCAPLIAENRAIGMLSVGFHTPHVFADDERAFVGTIARQCAQALARAMRLEAERNSAAVADRLRASLSTTLRSIADALIATDAAGRVTLLNGVAEELTGWKEEEAQGRLLSEVFRIVDEQTRSRTPNAMERLLETSGGLGIASQGLLLARNGREIPIDERVAPIRSEDGTIDGLVLVFRDVTEPRRNESRRVFLAEATLALAESLDYELTVAKVAQLAVPQIADWCAIDLLLDGDARVRRLAQLHADPSKLETLAELDAKYPTRPAFATGVDSVLASGRSELHTTLSDEYWLASTIDAGHLRLVRALNLGSAIIVPLTARGRVLGALTLARAVAGRKYDREDLALGEELATRCANAIENARLYQSEQQARRAADVANQAKDEFLAIVSHELRTPLNAIMGWAKMLPSLEVDPTRRRSAVETIERNAVAMAQLIEDLLDMSRVISGKLRIEVQEVDIVRVIQAAIDSIHPAALARSVELSTAFEADIPLMMGDPTRLQQIVWNLLSNAVKFTPKGGSVQVRLRRAGSAVEIAVTDTGKGIAPSFLPRVFEPFRQEDASSTRTRGGLGLGLAITKQLVELHGGTISAHSEGDNRGATFTVSLPISAVVPAVQISSRSGRQLRTESDFERPPQLRGLNVLVVDDDDDGRRLVATILEGCGCIVRGAASVRQALARFEEQLPDVLLSDIGMPGEDGYELIRQVRARSRERGGEVPAAALTAYARAEDRRNMLNAGYSIHLPKPVEPAELVAVVATLSRFVQRAES